MGLGCQPAVGSNFRPHNRLGAVVLPVEPAGFQYPLVGELSNTVLDSTWTRSGGAHINFHRKRYTTLGYVCGLRPRFLLSFAGLVCVPRATPSPRPTAARRVRAVAGSGLAIRRR